MKSNKLMRQALYLLILCMLTLTLQAASDSMASSSGLFVHPSKGQSEEQQAKDDSECFAWSRKEVGCDPMSPGVAVVEETKKERRAGGRT